MKHSFITIAVPFSQANVPAVETELVNLTINIDPVGAADVNATTATAFCKTISELEELADSEDHSSHPSDRDSHGRKIEHPLTPEEIQIEEKRIRNTASKLIRGKLRAFGIHFMSMSILFESTDEGAFLLLEATADDWIDAPMERIFQGEKIPDALDNRLKSYSKFAPLDRIAIALREELHHILRVAGLNSSADLSGFLKSHSHHSRLGLMGPAGLNFTGTPGMSVGRILAESRYTVKTGKVLERPNVTGTPLHILHQVRAEIEKDSLYAPLLVPDSVDLLNGSRPYATWKLIGRGVVTFLWPVLLLLALVYFISLDAMWNPGTGWLSVSLAFVPLAVAGLLFLAAFAGLYFYFRSLEDADVPDNSILAPKKLRSVMERENSSNEQQQNHLYGVYTVKPGWVRNFTLKLAYWVIGQLASRQYRPGYLADLGTINFARWILLPGTNKLLFLSNYGGSWESYLEDFISQAHEGLTGIWSNTVGYPRTRNLFQDGATDGDRFKRWARRQQRPTLFWYSAYLHLTTSRIRTNAAIRHGLASAVTEDEAATWISCFGSAARTADSLEVTEIQSILFGGFKRLTHSAAILIRLPEDVASARNWLAEMESEISFGDHPPRGKARLLALAAGGYRRLGLSEEHLAGFPIAFAEGMHAPHRKNILGDTGDDRPELWFWGSQAKPVDAILLVYCVGEPGYDENCPASRDAAGIKARNAELDHQIDRLKKYGVEPAHITMLETTNPDVPTREPFGFVDGISQPIIRGTQRWRKPGMHVVEAGEFILGYPDNSGNIPHSPSIDAIEDPDNLLPVTCSKQPADGLLSFEKSPANSTRDLGMNGSYLVVRQLEQDVDAFKGFLNSASQQLELTKEAPPGLNAGQIQEWVAAKMVGRWADGTSLVRWPLRPGNGWQTPAPESTGPNASSLCPTDRKPEKVVEPDNDFLLGSEDPSGNRCPFSAHIRRGNPRDSFAPGSAEQVAITNRHRILRVGRAYPPQPQGDEPAGKPGLMFMCLNGDIERQFEFIQQTWVMSRTFHGLGGEVDCILGRGHKGGQLTIPTASKPVVIKGIKDFVRVRGGEYFFLPSRRAIRFLSMPASRTLIDP